MNWEPASEIVSTLGECPVWDDLENRFFWTDIEAGRIYALNADQSVDQWQLPERVGSFGLTTRADRLVVALESGFALLNLSSEQVERFGLPGRLPANTRFNDGKCDPAGYFWAGTMSEATPRKPTGALYRLAPDLSVKCMRENICVSNSLAWSPAGDRIYFADSPTQTIITGKCSSDHGMTEVAELCNWRGEVGVPDGSETDDCGYLWTAVWDGWKLLSIRPDGTTTDELPVPVQRPTSCCFGGGMLTTLFVTTACIGLTESERAKQPLAGRILRQENAGRGHPTARFMIGE